MRIKQSRDILCGMITAIGSFALALCAGIAAIGYGAALAKCMQIKPNVGDIGIIGLACLGFLGCSLHLLVALSTVVQVSVLAVGTILFIVLQNGVRSAALISAWAIAGVCCFVCLHSQATVNSDGGLYYLQTFKWNHEFPITRGLGNLHGRLAFNSIVFSIAPLVDRLEIGWILNLLTIVFVSLSLYASTMNVESYSQRIRFWFTILALLAVTVKPGLWFGVMTADKVITILIVYWVALALGISDSPNQKTTLALLIISATLALTVKLSAGPLFAASLFMAINKKHVVELKRSWIFAGTLLAIWALRGILLSGCAIYPVRATCVTALPWAVSATQIKDEAAAIRSWGRKPGEADFYAVLRDYSWFSGWFKTASRDKHLQLLLVGALIAFGAIAGDAVKGRRRLLGTTLIVISSVVGGLLFWFYTAPDVRFGMGFILSAGFLGFSVAGASWLNRKAAYVYAGRGAVAVMCASVLVGAIRLRPKDFTYQIPTASVYEVRSWQNIGLWVTHDGDQCWAHDLPCTPYFDRAAASRIHWPLGIAPFAIPAKDLTPPTGWIPQISIYQPNYVERP